MFEPVKEREAQMHGQRAAMRRQQTYGRPRWRSGRRSGWRSWQRAVQAAALCGTLLAAGTGTATGAEPRPGPDPLPELHTRSPLPFTENTSDQWMPPRLTGTEPGQPGAQGAPRLQSRKGDPFPQYRDYRDLHEIEAVPKAEKGKLAPFCTRSTGPYQANLERYLKLGPVDGKQSPSDCKAIQAFQEKHRIVPQTGYAGPHTWGTAKLVHARNHPNFGGKCPVRSGRVACVNLSRQLMWVQQGKRIVFGPASIRTGMPGYETRTGMYSVYWRNEEHTSTLYDAPMPFAQFFSGGQAFHGRYRTIYYEPGSHGCINLSYRDAERLWKTLRKGDAVYIYGSKPPAP